MSTIATIEVSITDHPVYEVLVDCYATVELALIAARQLVQQDIEEMGDDEEVTCKELKEGQWKLSYKGSLNDWYVTERELKGA